MARHGSAELNSLLARTAGFLADVASDRPTIGVRAAVVADNADGLVLRDDVGALLGPASVDGISVLTGDDALGTMALADTLRPGDDRVRFGWLYVCGTLSIAGTEMQILQPLVSRLVQMRIETDSPISHDGYGETSVRIRATGDLELIPLISDGAVESSLLPQLPDPADRDATTTWAAAVIRSFAPDTTAPIQRTDPFVRAHQPGLAIVPRFGFHAGDREQAAVSDDERTLWEGVDGSLAKTSLAPLVLPVSQDDRPRPNHEPIETLGLQLNAEQVAVVHRARKERIVPVTGAPGTGKTRAIVSVALDAVSEGRSVLIATKSHHARDVVEEFLSTAPGPDPVTFGSEIDRARSVERLQQRQFGLGAGEDADAAGRYLLRLQQLQEVHAWQRVEAHAAWCRLWGVEYTSPERDGLAADAERLSRALSIRRELHRRPSLRRRALSRELVQLVEPEDGEVTTALRMIEEAVTESEAASTRAPFAQLLEPLEATAADLRRLAGEAAALRIQMSARATDLHAVRQLVRELSIGSRHRLFRRGAVSAASITAVEPLWLGTLGEIDRMLPASPAMFDLAIIDEAAQIGLGEALPALARAGSAVVVGDPQQIRHTTARTDREVEVAARVFDVPGTLVDRIAPNRVTAFDAAAQTNHVSLLRRHYRSVPHIIEFPAAEFYAGQVDVMTRRPQTESVDALLEIEVDGTWEAGVNQAEIDVVMLQLQAEFGRNRTVGVITPFPQQVAALVARVESDIGVQRVQELGLRVGTVDDFQGGERDLMIISTVVSAGAPSTAFEFINDPNVFNVMITRARMANYVVTSARPDDSTLLGRWLQVAASPPPPHPGSPTADPWVMSLADDFRAGGAMVRTNYPVGPHTIDLVVGQGAKAIGIDAVVPDPLPVDATQRRRELRSLRWRMLDLPQHEWGDRRAEVVTEILGQLGG